jgi:hypothetical protein
MPGYPRKLAVAILAAILVACIAIVASAKAAANMPARQSFSSGSLSLWVVPGPMVIKMTAVADVTLNWVSSNKPAGDVVVSMVQCGYFSNSPFQLPSTRHLVPGIESLTALGQGKVVEWTTATGSVVPGQTRSLKLHLVVPDLRKGPYPYCFQAQAYERGTTTVTPLGQFYWGAK